MSLVDEPDSAPDREDASDVSASAASIEVEAAAAAVATDQVAEDQAQPGTSKKATAPKKKKQKQKSIGKNPTATTSSTTTSISATAATPTTSTNTSASTKPKSTKSKSKAKPSASSKPKPSSTATSSTAPAKKKKKKAAVKLESSPKPTEEEGDINAAQQDGESKMPSAVTSHAENDENGSSNSYSNHNSGSVSDGDEVKSEIVAKSSNPKASTSKPSSSSTTYMQMVQSAITALKDRTGSSVPAITKWAMSTYSDLDEAKFKKQIPRTLKQGLQCERFVKFRASYKIHPKQLEKNRAKRKSQAAKLRAKAKSDVVTASKKDHPDAAVSTVKVEIKPKLPTVAEKAEQKRLERIRRRKFPMEDEKLHREDKELRVTPPSTIAARPTLPFVIPSHPSCCKWDGPSVPSTSPPSFTNPVSLAGTAASSAADPNAPMVTLAPYTPVETLWDNVLHVYHFFRGDVGWGKLIEERRRKFATTQTRTPASEMPAISVVAPFTLHQLQHAVCQVLYGNSKRSKALPPLLTHLFVVSLQYLTRTISTLSIGLDCTSWSEICMYYMDAMGRHYDISSDDGGESTGGVDSDRGNTTNSVEQILPGLPIDMMYLCGVTDSRRPDHQVLSEHDSQSRESSSYLQNGIFELLRRLDSYDPWMLTAGELMSLLRTLTDDMLAGEEWLEQELSKRMDETYEFSKQKRLADANFRRLTWANQRFETQQKEEQRKGNANGAKSNSENTIKGKKSEEAADRNGDSTTMELESNDGETNGKSSTSAAAPAPKKPSKGPPAQYIPPQQLESAKRAQQKAQDAYDKACRTMVYRTEPIGMDRSWNEVYFFDGVDCFYVKQKNAICKQAGGDIIPDELLHAKISWHILQKRSKVNAFVESLDVRGKREFDLKEALLPLRRFVVDDVKEEQNRRAQQRELQELQRKYENAKRKCEVGRKSGRLASQADDELMIIQADLEVLERKVQQDKDDDASQNGEDGKKKKSKKSAAIIPIIDDYYEATGLDLIRTFDIGERDDRLGRRASRRETRQQASSQSKTKSKIDKLGIPDDEWKLPKYLCSKLWPTGNIDGSGVVGRLVLDLIEMEEVIHSLAPWARGDMTRKEWTGALETLVHTWYNQHPPILGPMPEKLSAPAAVTTVVAPGDPMISPPPNKRRSLSKTPAESASKRRKLDQSSLTQVLSALKQPLLDLEARVFEITGLKMAAQDTDDADDNMSTASIEDHGIANSDKVKDQNTESAKDAWKKIIHKMKRIQARYHAKIRDSVIDAISSARKAHNGTAVTALKSALLEFHPDAAGSCKAAALDILERFGGYDETEEDDTDDDDENNKDGTENPNSIHDSADANETGLSSALSAQAIIMNASLDGHEDCSRNDWVDSVKTCKTISKLAALTTAFFRKSQEKVAKLKAEKDNLEYLISVWEKAANKKSRKGGRSPGDGDVSEVWTHVSFTDDFCLAKCEEYPWWPARKCHAQDSRIAASLAGLNKCLVSLVGEMGGLRVINMDDMVPFSETLPEDGSQGENHSKEVKSQLQECMAMTRRILRGKKHAAIKN